MIFSVRYYAAVFGFISFLSSLTAKAATDTALFSLDTTFLCLKEKQVSVVKHTYGANSRNKFIVIHDSENTSTEAGLDFLRANGGQLIELQYGDVRNVAFYHNAKKYEFDPNGIYTEPGLKPALKKYSLGSITPDALDIVRSFGSSLLQIFDLNRAETVVTLHNNTDNNFSIHDYLPGNALAKTTDLLHINPEMDPDDLLLVTELNYFNYLKERNLNVIYQSAKGPNDGSLSVYAQLNKIPYVNIEIQHEHFEEQRRLIEVVTEMIQSFKNSYTSSLGK